MTNARCLIISMNFAQYRSIWRHTLRWLIAGAWVLAPAFVQSASIDGVVTDKSGAQLSDAVIYAVPNSGTALAKPGRAAAVDQVNKDFMPLVTPVQTGTLVSFPNKDNIRHHVYSFSPPKTFELKLYSGVPSAPLLFDKPGVVVLGCNIHDWMLAYIYVVDTPYFAKTQNGRGRIEGLPAGEYDLKAWHPQLRGAVLTQRVKVGADSADAIKFTLDLLPKPPQAVPAGK